MPGRLECAECDFNTYENQKKVNTFYVWMSADPTTGNEGIIATKSPTGLLMTAMTSDFKLALQMEPEIKRACKAAHLKAKLIEFSRVSVKREV